MWTTITDSATVAYPHFTMTGPIEYDPTQSALAHVDSGTGEEEVISTDLTAHGYVPGPGEVFVKDWSEHHGFAAALQAAGLVEVLGTARVGLFSSTAYRVCVSVPSQ